ncbi:MAG: GTP 3',8-cyclase MoaA [Deltaproteobacteria bacterium]|nr:GTP 3',8-cyclase MoaA [Deltaproteobacteria bacterium]
MSQALANENRADFPLTGPIVDRFGRVFDYLRIAVNERCNLRCLYCMPEEGIALPPDDHILTGNEIERIVRIAANLGVTKIRFTGGEPLLRRDLVDIIRAAAATPGIRSTHLTTNGLLLEKRLGALKDAGLTAVNISLDTLQPERFKRIGRRDGWDRVWAAFQGALTMNFKSVKLNAVILRGENDDEIEDFARLTVDSDVTVRFIELMPFDDHQIWKTGRFVGADRLITRLRDAFPGLENASGSSTEDRIFRLPGGKGRVAVIPAYTRNMCGACTRIRLTADGCIRNCLFAHEELNLRERMRSGASDESIALAFREAMWSKAADGWEAQKRGREDRTSMTADRRIKKSARRPCRKALSTTKPVFISSKTS